MLDISRLTEDEMPDFIEWANDCKEYTQDIIKGLEKVREKAIKLQMDFELVQLTNIWQEVGQMLKKLDLDDD